MCIRDRYQRRVHGECMQQLKKNLHQHFGDQTNRRSERTLDSMQRQENRREQLMNSLSDGLEAAGVAEKNAMNRQEMEDEMVIHDDLMADRKHALYAIFDGHGGGAVKSYLSAKIASTLKQEINIARRAQSLQVYPLALEQTFSKLNMELELNKIGEEEGSTACVCLQVEEFGKKVFYIAHVGDTRCVIWHEGMKVTRLTKDHKAKEPEEQKRVREAGGQIMDGRLGGTLAITRAFGDFSLKNFGLSCKPDVLRLEVDPSARYLILATDGLWDVIDDKDISRSAFKLVSTRHIAHALVDLALKKGSHDNTTVIVIALKDLQYCNFMFYLISWFCS
eukprot:TRINITY_DN4073_c0_g3_i3.p1 TRINITY_DN4073_c0_g3~~TRINITY_DN4073_c0_g3_i3.p1  ORF type:complete len:335 (-),score=28.76 TRINITY_DN4073_c0_g3_i3:164-1168(-)